MGRGTESVGERDKRGGVVFCCFLILQITPLDLRGLPLPIQANSQP